MECDSRVPSESRVPTAHRRTAAGLLLLVLLLLRLDLVLNLLMCLKANISGLNLLGPALPPQLLSSTDPNMIQTMTNAQLPTQAPNYQGQAQLHNLIHWRLIKAALVPTPVFTCSWRLLRNKHGNPPASSTGHAVTCTSTPPSTPQPPPAQATHKAQADPPPPVQSPSRPGKAPLASYGTQTWTHIRNTRTAAAR